MKKTVFLVMMLSCLLFSAFSELSLASSYSDTERDKMEELWKVATLWEVGENREKVPKAREELTKFGAKAVDFILTEKIDTIDSLQTRAIDVVIQAIPEISVPSLLRALEIETRQYALFNIIRLLGGLKVTDSAPKILSAIKEGKLPAGTPLNSRIKRTIIDALGTLDYQPAIEEISQSLKSGDERERLIAAQSLSRFSSLERVEKLFSALGDQSFTVRMSANAGLVNAFKADPEAVWEGLSEFISNEALKGESLSDLKSSRLKGEVQILLGEIGSLLSERITSIRKGIPIRTERAKEILNEVISILEQDVRSEIWELRFRAVEALIRINDGRAREIIRELKKNEKHPLVLGLLLKG